MLKSSILVFLMAVSGYAYSKNEALNEPFIMRFEEETQYSLDAELQKALENKNWNRANDILYHETIQKKYGSNIVSTVDVEAAMKAFEEAAKEGIVIAAWQAYNLGKTLTPLRGAWSKNTLPRFAEYLLEANICQGYLDMGNFKGRGWRGGKKDFKEAVKILLEGKKVCNRKDAPDWQKKQWAAEYYKYKTLRDYPEAMKCKK